MAVQSMIAARPPHVPESALFDFDIFCDEGLATDPHARILRLVQEAPPLFWTPRNGGHWMAIGYQEAFRILREPENFSSALVPPEMAGVSVASPHDGRRMPLMTPIMMDLPEHTRHRAPLQKTFSPKAVIALKGEIEDLAASLIDAVAPLGRTDFVSAVTEQLPVRIFLRMMGLPDDRIGEYRSLVRELLAPTPADPLEQQMRMRRIGDAMLDRIVARRTDRRADIISLLWDVEIDGQPMTLELMEDYCCLLFVAGLDTVINALTYGVRHLAGDPHLQALLRARPDRVPEATEELLRRYAFSGAIRIVARDCALAGTELKAGEQLFVYLAGVNLDPREFPAPDRFDIERENKNHLIFGAGPHRCLGSHLARLELQTLYHVVLDRLPEFRMDPERRPVFHPGYILSVSSLPIRWD